MSTFENSLANGIHKKLLVMTGSWSGVTKVWFGPGEPADISETQAEITSVLEGRFIQHAYSGMFQGKKSEGMHIIGYSFNREAMQCAWIDTFHMGTGIMFSTFSGETIQFTGAYGEKGKPEDWKWRTEFHQPHPDALEIRHYNIEPDGTEMLAIETIYQRIK